MLVLLVVDNSGILGAPAILINAGTKGNAVLGDVGELALSKIERVGQETGLAGRPSTENTLITVLAILSADKQSLPLLCGS